MMMEDFLEIFLNDTKAMAATTCRGHCAHVEDAYSGFSVCDYTGDAPEHYLECRRILADGIGIGPRMIVMPRQTHTDNVLTITKRDCVAEETLQNVDALVTNLRGIAIGINTADCVPVLLVDEEHGVCGAAHAGWRGAVKGIAGKCVAAMMNLGAKPSDIKAFIAPCIHVECFEVGEEVAREFEPQFVHRQGFAKPHVDLPAFVADNLVKAGIPLENISVSDRCTRCNPDRYFSARASGIESGRNFSFVMLK